MAWYFNFCSPYVPNDLMINFHRKFQAGQIIVLMLIYMTLHTYYRLWGPNPLQQQHKHQQKKKAQKKKRKSKQQQSDHSSQIKSDEDSQQNKSVSIAQRIKNSDDQNASYISFKNTTTGNSWNRKRNPVQDTQITMIQNVTVRQVQNYFPIVFGHHAIAMGASIMYTPYAQQSIAAILYVLFTFLLIISNSKRYDRTTMGLWIFMALLNIFIFISALLQVGQSNWDYINNVCFAQQYVGLY